MSTLVKNHINTQSEQFSGVSLAEIELIEYIENKLINILLEDKKLVRLVFISIKDGVIKKIANYISGAIDKSISIGIAGETASGKSTITFDIIDSICNFEKDNDCKKLITRVNTDDYYYDRSDMVKAAGSFDEFVKNYDLDSPDAFELDLLNEHIARLKDGVDVWLPKYDMSGTAKRFDNHNLAQSAKIIISEGLYTLTDKVQDVFDFKIYVDVSAKEQEERWYRRAAQRDLGKSADRVFNNAVSKAQIYVKPTAKNADIVLNGEANRKDYKMFTDRIFELINEVQSRREKVPV